MAGDWMKIELELPDKPKVHAIAANLGIDPDAVVGKLIRVWQWFDKHTIDGNAYGVTFSMVDRITSVTGFGEAMMFVGWLEQNDKNLTMPKFDDHTSASAKQRALTAKRVAKSKVKSNGTGNDVSVTNGVSQALPREEKRREDIKPKSKDLSAHAAQTKGTRLPDDWVLPKAWGEWALQERPELTADDVRKMAAMFKDHWIANANRATGKKADWLATWRNWVRNQKSNQVQNKSVQQARLTVAEEIMGVKNGTNRPIREINPRPAIEGSGTNISETPARLREPDAS